MKKITKYLLVSFGITVTGLSIVSMTEQSWLPVGIGMAIFGTFGLLLAPLFASLE